MEAITISDAPGSRAMRLARLMIAGDGEQGLSRFTGLHSEEILSSGAWRQTGPFVQASVKLSVAVWIMPVGIWLDFSLIFGIVRIWDTQFA